MPQSGQVDPGRKRKWFLLYLAVLAFLGLGALEIWARTRAVIQNIRDERRLFYEYDAELGWLPRKDSESVAHLCQTITVRHNSQHFRDREHAPGNKPAICVIGDSFVWGFDVDAEVRFTDKLQERLPEYELYNMGVSGYSTDQEYLLLRRYYEELRPKLVLLVFACDPDGDDRKGNASNKAYRYFKPHFASEGGKLVVQGVPVPKNSAYRTDSLPAWLLKSALVRYAAAHWPEPELKRGADMTEPILEDMQRWLAERGVAFVIAKNDPDPALEAFCQRQSIPLIDLASVDARYRFPDCGKHWTAEGHERVAALVEAGLRGRL